MTQHSVKNKPMSIVKWQSKRHFLHVVNTVLIVKNHFSEMTVKHRIVLNKGSDLRLLKEQQPVTWWLPPGQWPVKSQLVNHNSLVILTCPNLFRTAYFRLKYQQTESESLSADHKTDNSRSLLSVHFNKLSDSAVETDHWFKIGLG